METSPLSTFAANLFIGRTALMTHCGYLLDDPMHMRDPEV